jgi:hypothetical protein
MLIVLKIQVSREMISPQRDSNPCPIHVSGFIMNQYLNVCQRKLRTFIFQTVHILRMKHDSAVTGSLPDQATQFSI